MILLMAMLVIINYYKWFFLKESTYVFSTLCEVAISTKSFEGGFLILKNLQAQPLLEIIYVSFISNN